LNAFKHRSPTTTYTQILNTLLITIAPHSNKRNGSKRVGAAWLLTHKNLSPYTSSLQDTHWLQRRKVESVGRIEAVNKPALAGGRIV